MDRKQCSSTDSDLSQFKMDLSEEVAGNNERYVFYHC